MSTIRSSSARAVVLLAGVLVVSLLGSAPAFAHVEVEGTTGPGGATAVTFSFTHGCAGSPTTSLRVQLPAGTTDVTAQSRAGFTAATSSTEIAWTGGSIADGAPGSFTAAMTLTGAKGDVVYLPTIQGCTTGEAAWIDKTPDAEAEHAAPRITLGETTSATTAADHDHDATGGTTAGPTTTAKASATTSPGSSPTTSGSAGTTAKAASTTAIGGTTVPPTSSTSSSTPIGLIVGVIALALILAAIVFALMRRRATT